MTLYWVSCIIFDKGDRAPWTCSAYSGVTSYEEAMKLIDTYRKTIVYCLLGLIFSILMELRRQCITKAMLML